MAAFPAIAKLISSLIAKRGFSAAASQGVVSKGAVRSSRTMVKKTREEIAWSTEKVSWVLDPRIGFYRLENTAEEIDVAELCAVLLNKR